MILLSFSVFGGAGEISFWNCEDTTLDQWGSNDADQDDVAFVADVPSFNTSGSAGTKSCDYDGNDFWNINDSNDLDITENLTISLWVNVDAQTKAVLTGKDDNGQRAWVIDYRPDLTPDKLRFQTYDSGGTPHTSEIAVTLTNNIWYHIVGTYDGKVNRVFLDGNQTGSLANTADIKVTTANLQYGARDYNGAEDFCDCQTDNMKVWNINLSFSAIQNLTNFGNTSGGVVPPPTGDTLNLSDPFPKNDTGFNSFPIDINLTANSTAVFNCSLILNEVLNQTLTGFLNGSDIFINFTFLNMSDGQYNYSVNCTNGISEEITPQKTFFVDFEPPTFVTNFINHTINFNKNLTGQWNLSDNDQLHTLNVTIDGGTIFNITHIHAENFTFNLTYDASSLAIGNHTLGLEFADGHTAKKLRHPNAYKFSNGLFNDYAKYNLENPYKEVYVKIKGNSIFDSFSTEYAYDRYNIIYDPWTRGSSYTFSIETDEKIYVYNDEKYNGDWIVFGEHWLDFHIPTEPNMVVDVSVIDDYEAEVTITGVNPNTEILNFNSIGDLNIVNLGYIFYVANMTEQFSSIVLGNFITSYNLTVDFNELLFNITGLTPIALLELNGTNYSTSLLDFNVNNASFQRNFDGDFTLNNLSDGTIDHQWHFNLTNLTQGFLSSDVQQQEKFDVLVGLCNATHLFPILNITYFDEIGNNNITANNFYSLPITDGTFFYNQTESFAGNTSDSFCTNVNSSVLTYNWDMWGTFTLSKLTYVTRIVEYAEDAPLTLSNNPTTNLSLFLIKINESSTIVFNWLTLGYQPIDGIMRVFRCNNDGSRSLTESVPVTGGSTGSNSPNLQLLTQAYAYDIIIDGTIFQDFNSYSKCHVETQSERTYFVNVDETDISPILGLFSIECDLTKITNESVRMTWEANPEVEGFVSGCISVDRTSINGSVTIFDNCSTLAEGFSRVVVLPINSGNEFVVRGRLEQNNATAFCRDTIVFSPNDIPGGLFSTTGLIGAFLLILSLALFYSAEGEITLFASIVGIIASWIIGIMNMPWIYPSALMFFLLIIAYVGRHARQSG